MEKYTQNEHITTVKEVEKFFHHLAGDLKISFHPDDDFADYVDLANNEPTLKPEEVYIYNRLMEEAFAVCEKDNVDIYEIGLKILESM